MQCRSLKVNNRKILWAAFRLSQFGCIQLRSESLLTMNSAIRVLTFFRFWHWSENFSKFFSHWRFSPSTHSTFALSLLRMTMFHFNFQSHWSRVVSQLDDENLQEKRKFPSDCGNFYWNSYLFRSAFIAFFPLISISLSPFAAIHRRSWQQQWEKSMIFMNGVLISSPHSENDSRKQKSEKISENSSKIFLVFNALSLLQLHRGGRLLWVFHGFSLSLFYYAKNLKKCFSLISSLLLPPSILVRDFIVLASIFRHKIFKNNLSTQDNGFSS